jgi:dienelactone hydrolase
MKITMVLPLALLLLFSSSSQAQNYLTGTRSVTFTDPSRSNRSIPTDLYYPSNTAGANVALASGIDSFPVVVIGHGFSLTPSSYVKLADSLARTGYIVALPNTETGLSPSHDNFGKDIAFLAEAIPAQNAVSTSFLYQRVKPRAAVGGHSMGGGCSFLAAASGKPEIKALFNFAAAETTPSATAAAASVNFPTLIFAGSRDCIVPPATQLAMYNNTPAACKTYINITGATHCLVANNNGLCTFGQTTSGCNNPSITVDAYLIKTLSLLRPFLDYVLKENCFRGLDYIDTYLQISGITDKLSTCAPPSCSILSVSLLNFSGSYRNNAVELSWQTTGEAEVLDYTVQKSQNGTDFTDAGHVNGQGPGNHSYSSIDLLPYPMITYYRLKVMNPAGQRKYSAVISVQTSADTLTIKFIYPNPAKDKLWVSITSTTARTIQYQFVDMKGSLAGEGRIAAQSGSETYSLDVSQYAPGTYIFKLSGENGESLKTSKVIIN